MTSWWCLWSTVFVFVSLIAAASSDLWWPTRFAASVLAGLTLVRLFILFHDQQHGTIFRGSKFARGIMWLFGLMSLNPPSVWKSSHDHHHRNNSRGFTRNTGSFPVMTVEEYCRASLVQRFAYRCSRHPLMMGFGYVTVFAGWMCLSRLVRHPVRHWDAALALIAHGALAWLLFPDLDSLLLGWILPFMIGSGFGTYLFFVQHNFPGVRLQPEAQWSYVFSALHSSSYFETGQVMRWFTGNIGYHHVHHLNAKIPFYRLPEAMAAIEELQSPGKTSLAMKEIAACLRQKLWNATTGEFEYWPSPETRLALAVAR